jgi:acetyltransferase
MTVTSRDPLIPFLEPESVALVGVSRRSGSGAYNGLEMMRRFGYEGRLLLVHPKAEDILGERPFPSVAKLPERPDLAVITVGRERVGDVVGQCVDREIPAVVVVSQGFADAGETGQRLQQELVERVRGSATRLLGPNTMGVLNAHRRFSTAFLDLPRPEPAPPLSLVAQSGVFQVGPEQFIGPLGKAVDIGNTADVDAVDALDHFATDPETSVVALYLEGIQRGQALVAAVRRAADRKPVVVLKSGRSAAGAEAALSHTGSLVGEDAVVDAALARAGAVRVENNVALRAACLALQRFRRMVGPRIGFITCTGAAGIMGADACEDYGLTLAAFPPALREELTLPRMAWHRLDNPADIWPVAMGSGDYLGFFQRTARGLLADPGVDALACVMVCKDSPLHQDHDLVAATRELAEQNPHHKPIALWLYGSGAPRQSWEINAAGLPAVAAFDTLDTMMMGLAAAWQREKRLRALDPPRRVVHAGAGSVVDREIGASASEDAEPLAAAPTGGPPPGDVVPTTAPRAPLPEGSLLVGRSAHAFLEAYGVPLAPGAVVGDADAAAAKAAALGFPVVIKLVSPRWLHKTEQGGVILDLRDEAAVRRAAAELLGRYDDADTAPAAASEGEHDDAEAGARPGLWVQKQLQGVELLCGIKRDPELGPVVVVGQGGIHTEIFRDVSHGLAPLRQGEPERMLERLRIAPLLAGARGAAPVDRAALQDLLRALSTIAEEHPRVTELDLNPVVATPEGCFAVDARIVVGEPG